ncbi:DNA-binding NarL/FixJ family response regulator [Algoriphagus boseongensis]|uniref:DNA-binding NarL/FixJ family response regulator n=1 Tax=Algoriphagus boseongensis TaxID=1442587 RepID=A0A4R6TB41_9BACT|nr:response regulator transcription factor [Algoriphagus boseongensis]TDQ19429.1 DNA-binding NarL/FixJ family response regulator [Algoriphagus boseongensis]
MIRLGIAEDSPYILKALIEKLSSIPEVLLKIKALNGKDLLEKIQLDSNLDLILMDIEMPEMNGIEATYQIKQRWPQIKVVMLTVFDSDDKIFNSIRAGADGYLLKDAENQDLEKAIRDTLEGGAAMTPSIALKTLRLLRNPHLPENLEDPEEVRLSKREIEILEQLSKGLKYKMIADNLFLSVGTVKKHVDNIYSKLQAHNKLEAIQKAKSNRLIG